MKSNKANTAAKAKTNNGAKATAGAKTKAQATVIVPAALKANVQSIASAIDARVTATKREGQSWVETADTLKKLFKTYDDASPVLKQAFEDAKLVEGMYASYRSAILKLAFPVNEAELVKAKEDKLPTHKLVAVARGSLKRSKRKDGGWLKVERAETRGGSNKVQPLEAFGKAMALAFTAAQTGKLDEDQLATAIAEAAEAAGYDVEALASAIESKA